MNIEAIKTATREHYLNEEKQREFNTKVDAFKRDIILEFRKWQSENPGKSFDDFKSKAHHEMGSIPQLSVSLLSIGLYVTAMDELDPETDFN